MKAIYLSFIFLILCLVSLSQKATSIHDYTVKTIDGDVISFKKYYGKKLLLVNTASFCGYTPQFAGLELTYKNFKQFDFEIIGFPSNDFGNQDPYGDSSIHVFCSANYGVTFPMMSKIAISKGDTSPVYRWLQQKNLNGVKDQAVDWNFNKFLINESGEWVRHYSSQTLPNDTAILNWILSPSSIHTAIKNNNNVNFLKMKSPNPVDKKIELEFNNGYDHLNFKLFSINGKVVSSIENIALQDSGKLSINVSDLSDGIYLMMLENGKSAFTSRVIVSH